MQWSCWQLWQSASNLMSSCDTHDRQKDLCMKCPSLTSNSVSGTLAWCITNTLKTVLHTLTISTWHSFLTSVLSKVHYGKRRVVVNQSLLQNQVNVSSTSVSERRTWVVTIKSIDFVVFNIVVGSVGLFGGWRSGPLRCSLSVPSSTTASEL